MLQTGKKQQVAQPKSSNRWINHEIPQLRLIGRSVDKRDEPHKLPTLLSKPYLIQSRFKMFDKIGKGLRYVSFKSQPKPKLLIV